MIGLGLMRLSTARDRDDTGAIAVIHAALDAGVTLLDTADAYCHHERDIGHNERLVAEALRLWTGHRVSIEVATKGGLTRPKGAWVPDGKAKHLRAACEASRQALGVETIDLYQLHAVDPRTPLETSVRALAALQDAGLVRRVGLCNVTVGQIIAARAIVDVASVQVSLSPFDDENLGNGVAEYCRDQGIRLIAHRPLGGEKAGRLARDPVVSGIAERRGVTPAEVVLAWLLGLGVVPIPGATRVATAASAGRTLALRLTPDEAGRLDDRFSGRLLRVPRARRRPPDDANGEVVLIMGMPGAGKSSTVAEFEGQGYERLNRDDRGGSLAQLVPQLALGLKEGRRRWVLDNTYPSRRSRNAVVECAWAHGVPVRCVWLTTDIADAQVNAIARMLAVHGSLPGPEELRALGKADPRYMGPDALFRYERTLEPPVPDEGFAAIEQRPFARREVPGAMHRAVVMEFDDVLCAGPRRGAVLRPDDVRLLPGRREVLTRHAAEGWLLFTHAWRPQVSRGETSAEDVNACLTRARELLEVDLQVACCPHDAGPPVCWCRKPLPGLVLAFALPNAVSLAASRVAGRSPADRTLATRLGMGYFDASEFFGSP